MAKRNAPRASGRGKKAKRTAAARKPGRARKPARRRKAPARQARLRTAKKSGGRKTSTTRPGSAKRAPAPGASAAPARKAPALTRERRTIGDDERGTTLPSSLDLDRSASAARSGRRELHERFTQHTETGPAMTGGDIDADWESAYSVGDEAPGGDNPTPDQDIVDDIGRAIGVEYEDNEELKGDKKITERDRRRWELDPASSDDYDER